MFVYYKSKILFVLYDNCDDTYSFYLLFHILVYYVTRILCLWKYITPLKEGNIVWHLL